VPIKFVLFVACYGMLLTGDLAAQSVRPVIVEYKAVARGKFEVTNVGATPLNVILEPKSFHITEDGDGVYGRLDEQIHLKLSAMSMRIPAKQSRFIFYEARPDVVPAWFVIYSTFGNVPNAGAANLQIALPHTVYVLQKQPLLKRDLEIESAHYVPETHQLIVRLANHGNDLGRALGCEAKGKAHREEEPGFPMLPQSHRTLTMNWGAETPPESVSVRFANFSLKQDLRVGN
jgi:hypothetical protein